MRSILARLFQRGSEARGSGAPDHCVLVRFKLQSRGFGDRRERDAIHAFTDQLAAAIASAGVGEFDGDEFGEGECTLFMYGPDAERLYTVVAPLLANWEPLRGGFTVKRYGSPGSPEQRISF